VETLFNRPEDSALPAAASAAPPQRQRTPAFVCEVPLRVAPASERVLLARLEAARQVRVTCLGEAKRRVGLVRQSNAFQRARTLQRDDPTRRALFARARAACACSEYGVHASADQLRPSWLGDPLDRTTCQKRASRASAAANRLLLGQARRVRGVSRHQLDRVAGKTNTSGLRWRGPQVEWNGLVLPARLSRRDRVQAHGLACPVTDVRLVRRQRGERKRFSAHLVCQGVPYQQPQPQVGSGIVGLDLGPSALAVASLQPARLSPCCPEVAPATRALRRLDRQLDRPRRAKNPANDDGRGLVKRGPQRWKASKRQRQVQPRPARASGARAGQPRSAGAALLSGVAADLWEVGPALCPRDECRAVVSSG
jgi:putative transposase